MRLLKTSCPIYDWPFSSAFEANYVTCTSYGSIRRKEKKTQKFLQDCTDEHYRHRDALCVPPVANYPGAQIERDFLTSCGCTGGTALDIGAGNGNFLALPTQMGFDCLGIEPNPPRAAVVRDAGLRVLER